MLERISMGQPRTREKTHRIHIACKDKGRSEADMLHRFIAQLKLPNFQIEKVNILENPCKAKMVLRGPQGAQIDSHGFSSLFKRKKLKSNSQLKLNFDLHKLDAKGLNFFIDYEFEYRCLQTAHNIETDLNENVHGMIQTVFETSRSFSISQMPDVEII